MIRGVPSVLLDVHDMASSLRSYRAPLGFSQACAAPNAGGAAGPRFGEARLILHHVDAPAGYDIAFIRLRGGERRR